MTERLHFHFSLSCIGEGNGNPLQCSCLENPRDRGAWWAAIYGVAQSQTRLKWFSSSSSSKLILCFNTNGTWSVNLLFCPWLTNLHSHSLLHESPPPFNHLLGFSVTRLIKLYTLLINSFLYQPYFNKMVLKYTNLKIKYLIECQGTEWRNSAQPQQRCDVRVGRKSLPDGWSWADFSEVQNRCM